MIQYEYQLVRYTPDMVTGEFVNVGIVFYSSTEKFLSSEGIKKHKRVTNFFDKVNASFLLSSLKHINARIEKISEGIKSELNLGEYNTITEITSRILPNDDSALQMSDVFRGVTLNLDATFRSIYYRYIGHFETNNQVEQSPTDEDVWRHTYKNYFDKYGITSKLKTHTISLPLDEMTFNRSIKNHIWHCFETVSFDLKDNESIKDKAYKWAGKLNNLSEAQEDFKLYILLLEPTRQKTKELNQFIEKTLKLSRGSDRFEIIEKDEAESFVKRISAIIEEN